MWFHFHQEIYGIVFCYGFILINTLWPCCCYDPNQHIYGHASTIMVPFFHQHYIAMLLGHPYQYIYGLVSTVRVPFLAIYICPYLCYDSILINIYMSLFLLLWFIFINIYMALFLLWFHPDQ